MPAGPPVTESQFIRTISTILLNPIVAMASKLVIAEVDVLVEPGEIGPDMVVTPGVFVDRIVQIPDGGLGSEKYKKENFAILLENEIARQIVFARKR